MTDTLEIAGEVIDMTTTSAKATAHPMLGWIVVLTASLFFFYTFIQLNLFNAIDVELMQAFKLNALQLGQLASLFFYANALFLFPAGILLDRYSTKKILLIAVTLCTIGTFLFALSAHYPQAAVARFLIGTSAAFCFLSCVRLSSRWFAPSKMAFVTGIVVTMAMLGGLVAQTPFALLSKAIGWRHAVLLDGILGIFITIAIAIFVQDHPHHSHEEHKADKAKLKKLGLWQSVRLVLSNRYNWLGGIYTSLLNLPVFILGALWGIHYLVQAHHLNYVQASYATTVFFLGVIIGSPAFGWFSDHIGRRVLPMAVGAISSLVIMLMLLGLSHLSLGSLMGLFFLIGFTTSSQVLSYPTIAELNPTALTSTAVSVASVIIMCSGAIFLPLFGWIMQWQWNHQMVDNIAVYSVQDFNRGMMIMPIASVVGLMVAMLIKETYCTLQQKE